VSEIVLAGVVGFLVLVFAGFLTRGVLSRSQGTPKMQEIATIPSLQVLRGMFVNVINSPIQGLAIALNAIAQKKQ